LCAVERAGGFLFVCLFFIRKDFSMYCEGYTLNIRVSTCIERPT
jgi:hypothetical protein